MCVQWSEKLHNAASDEFERLEKVHNPWESEENRATFKAACDAYFEGIGKSYDEFQENLDARLGPILTGLQL